MLLIRFRDILRATLPLKSGNEGWIGISPGGEDYHVVVPVDVQIARGVMACNRPTDGTPFGGYAGWRYFRCPPYEAEAVGSDEGRDLRWKTAQITAKELVRRLASYGISAEIVGDAPPESDQGGSGRPSQALGRSRWSGSDPGVESKAGGDFQESLRCTECGDQWSRLGAFLRDDRVRFVKYVIRPDDFRRGQYLFSHQCGGTIGVPVLRFARPKLADRSLVGTHACPGLCYYESSTAACSALCEGAVYRRLARRLMSL